MQAPSWGEAPEARDPCTPPRRTVSWVPAYSRSLASLAIGAGMTGGSRVYRHEPTHVLFSLGLRPTNFVGAEIVKVEPPKGNSMRPLRAAGSTGKPSEADRLTGTLAGLCPTVGRHDAS